MRWESYALINLFLTEKLVFLESGCFEILMSHYPKGPNNVNQNDPNTHLCNGKIYKRLTLICELRTEMIGTKKNYFVLKLKS